MTTSNPAPQKPSGLRRWRRWRAIGFSAVLTTVLLALGLINIYPFGWMIGTSLKSPSEAARDRQMPLPGEKYFLASTEMDLSRFPLTDSQKTFLLELQRNDRSSIERGGTFVPTRMTQREYQQQYSVATEALAEQELQQLVGLGLLKERRLQLENYAVVWSDMRFYLNTMTSLVLTIAVVVLTILSSSMLGYALARLAFPGKKLLVMLLLISVVAPGEAMLVPVFRMLLSSGLLDGLAGMVLWISGVGIGHALLMGGFFLTLPREVEEAAAIDGAGVFTTFFDIALPMAKPVVATVGLFAFLGAWNNFMVPLVCALSTPRLQPLALAVYTFQQGRAGEWHLTNAAASIMTVPAILLFIFLQKHIVRSVAAGAVKG